jgi:hypothetical protein
MFLGQLDEIRFMFWCLIIKDDHHITKFGFDGYHIVLVLCTTGKYAIGEGDQAEGKYVLSHGGKYWYSDTIANAN